MAEDPLDEHQRDPRRGVPPVGPQDPLNEHQGDLGGWPARGGRGNMWPMGGIKWYTCASNSMASEISLSVAFCSRAYEALPSARSLGLLWPQHLCELTSRWPSAAPRRSPLHRLLAAGSRLRTAALTALSRLLTAASRLLTAASVPLPSRLRSACDNYKEKLANNIF